MVDVPVGTPFIRIECPSPCTTSHVVKPVTRHATVLLGAKGIDTATVTEQCFESGGRRGVKRGGRGE